MTTVTVEKTEKWLGKIKKCLCALCSFETEKVKAELETVKKQLVGDNKILKSRIQELETLEELKQKLNESGITDEKVVKAIKTLSEETLVNRRNANIRASEWIEIKKQKWSNESATFLVEQHSDMIGSAKKEDLSQDILKYLDWIGRSLRQGDYQKLDIIPSIPYTFPYQKALQFISDNKDTDGLSPTQAIRDLEECFKHLLQSLNRKG